MSLAGLLQTAAAMVVVATVLATLNVRQHFIELFAHYRMQYFVSSLVFVLVFAALQRFGLAVVMLATAAFNGFYILPWYAASALEKPGTARLTLMHANVLSKNKQHQRVIDGVSGQDPDVVFLQEINGDWVSGLRPLEDSYPYSYKEPRQGNFGIAVYSKIPFESVRHIDSPPLSYPTIVASLKIDGEALTLISSHPTIPLGKTLYEARNRHLDSLRELLDDAHGKTVLLGDFNATMWDRRLRELLVVSGLRSARQGFGMLPTWPVWLPIAMIPIDHIMVPEDISVTALKTGRTVGSDHLPLIATLKW